MRERLNTLVSVPRHHCYMAYSPWHSKVIKMGQISLSFGADLLVNHGVACNQSPYEGSSSDVVLQKIA